MKLNYKQDLLGGLLGRMARLGVRNFDFPSENKKSSRYPEQSQRQAMRQHRRAQGGPGIVFNDRTGQYEPRS